MKAPGVGGNRGMLGPQQRSCWLRVAGCAGAAFLALSASVDNLVTYLFGPGWLWIIGGTFITVAWAYEGFCHGFGDK